MIVDFEPWEYIHAHDVGIRRAVANWKVKDKQSYQNGRNQPEIIASPAAALCELAVAKALNKHWSGHVWDNRDHKAHKHMADIEPNIEVRRIRDKKNPVAVWQKDYGRGRTLVVCFPVEPEFRQVEILGWLPLDIAWEKGEQRYAKDCRVFPVSKLRSIETLEI